MGTESFILTKLKQKKHSSLLKPILECLNVNSYVEAANILDVFPSVFSDSERRGRISDKLYIALARHGIDIRELLSKEASKGIKDTLSHILNVNSETSAIAIALGVKNEEITECEELGYVTDKVLIALARKGYDIREFWMDTASLK